MCPVGYRAPTGLIGYLHTSQSSQYICGFREQAVRGKAVQVFGESTLNSDILLELPELSCLCSFAPGKP